MDVNGIPVLEYVADRAKEMEMMLKVSQAVSGNDLPQQRLPRHMRRRAANHNIKRLPCNLRHKVPKDLLAIQKKRPSRKHRRRPSNLLKEYAKRSSKKRWLETHIWHAKRFRMMELWNCKIAEKRNDRGVRAAYRDSRRECLIIDISWLHCFEIAGREEDIISSLEPFICNFSEASSIVSRFYRMGQHEGETIFYKKENDRNIPISSVKFLWRFDITPQPRRSLMIWIHPSSGNEFLDHFKDVLKLIPSENNDQFLTNNVIDLAIKTKDFCRYKLIGPKSQSVLWSALKLSEINSKQFKQLYEYTDEEISTINDQNASWSNLKTTNPVTFPSHIVHGLVVGDPRLNMPTKRLDSNQTGIFSNFNHPMFNDFKNSISYSSLWNQNLMTKLQEVKLSTHNMNELRSGSLLTDYNPAIPILLIQNPGCLNNAGDQGHGSGWDVIIPGGWGMAFWLGLVYRGARSMGTEELARINYETGHLSFPEFYPDSKSGKEFHLLAYQKKSSKFERMPKSKRPNYKKLKVQTPFHCPWQEICEEWNQKSRSDFIETSLAQNFFVIRDNKFLQELDKSLVAKFSSRPDGEKTEKPTGKVLRKVTVRGSSNIYLSVERKGAKKIVLDKSQTFQLSRYIDQNICNYSMGVVPVVIEISEKGCHDFSTICIPSGDDVLAFAEDRRDIFETPGNASSDAKYDVAEIQKVANVVDFCSRQAIGFSVVGGFSFFKGKGRLLGFVSLPGLERLYSDNHSSRLKCVHRSGSPKNIPHNLVVVRSSTSSHYNFATVKTIFNITQ